MYAPRRTKLVQRIIPILVFVLILFLSITLLKNTTKPTKIRHLHVHNHLQIAHAACEGTLYRDLCVSTLASIPDLSSKSLPELVAATVNQTMFEVRASSNNCSSIERNEALDIQEKRAVDDCLELLSYTMADLRESLTGLSTRKAVSQNYHNLQTIFSAAITNQYTCLDGFAYSKGDVRDIIKRGIFNISHHVSNSLVILKKIPGLNKKSQSEVSPEHGRVKKGFPTWLKSKDRKLLQAPVNETKFDLIVAKDGSGNFTTISQAVAAAPNNSDTRFVSKRSF
ncbi:hypothetical protein SLEP1_g59954 [Rubroshorea leprosula]|uniref:Pectinesterase inhibitor domain-containing protein n=1 Tax=Rubroshorea leprosula TaxID=152421 RepID=A0AAV5MXZ6_9ROSI|nr:hypothetical protein SLEP1_g59954 [Rubroshorea leprosula]